MAPADIHPCQSDLEAFTLGTLDDASLAGVEAHVADCPTCQECAAGASGDTLVELLRRVHDRGSASRAQTPIPVPATTEMLTLAHVAPTGTEGTEVIEVIPAELARHQRYRVLRLLGAGGMGAVYEAEHRVMRRPVAIKVINRAFTTNSAAVERFRREVRAAARLTHPNIVTTYDAEDAADSLFLVMEYAQGVSLSRLVQERGPLPVAEACDAIGQAALGLQHAHERGLVHRDIKPQNLMRTSDGVVKVLDFGLAVLADAGPGEGLTDGTVVMGTPDYIAPEQAEDARDADVRSDVYSLGCTFYHLLTGRVPFAGDSVLRKLDAHRTREPEPVAKLRPEVPAALAAVVAKMMAKKPADRYQTAGEVAKALASASEIGTRNAPRKPRRRWAIAAAMLFAGAIAAAGVVFSIKTDNGTIEIQTDDENVKVIAEGSGKQVTVLDPKSKQTWVVDTGEWTVRLDGNPDGLKLDMPATFTLKRGEKRVVTIRRVKGTDPIAVVPTAGEKVGEVRRIPWEGGGKVYTTAISPDSRYYMASGDPNPVRLWDLKTGKQLYEFVGNIAFFTPDGKQVLTGSWKNTQFRLYDVTTGKEIRTFGEEDWLYGFRLSPDGKYVASITESKKIHIWDLATGKEMHTFTGETNDLRLLFSSDGKRLVYSLDGKPSRVLDLATGKEVRAYEKVLEKETLYRFLPGDREIMAYHETTFQFYEVATGKLLREHDLGEGAKFWFDSLDVDCRRVLATYPDGTFRLWDLTTGKVLHRWAMIDGKNPRPAFISPDGRYASGISDDGSVYLWRLPEPPAPKKP